MQGYMTMQSNQNVVGYTRHGDGPYHVMNLSMIQHNLQMPHLTSQQVLSTAREALIYGKMESTKIPYASQNCHCIAYQTLRIVLTEGFDCVVGMAWNGKTLPTNSLQTHRTKSSTNSQQNAVHTINDNLYLDDQQETILNLDDIVDQIVEDIVGDKSLPPLPPNEVYNIPPNNLNLTAERSFYSQSGVADDAVSVGSRNNNALDIKDTLFNELKQRYEYLPDQTTLHQYIWNALHNQSSGPKPIYYDDGNVGWYAYYDQHFVYILEKDLTSLFEMFSRHHWETFGAHCVQAIILRHHRLLSQAYSSHRKLQTAISGRSLVSNISCATSKRSASSNPSSPATAKHEYHTIYLKPIIERMKYISNCPSIDSEYIIDIVDKSIKCGVKRQISKRTFEFKYDDFTVIMSKSLKTILDVTSSKDVDIITVHPDVVSIISKQCSQLNYFKIQELAKKAKLNATFTTKKNDYRQQFIYEYAGCRIVFASNHATIVEMKCNDHSLLTMH